MKIFLISRGYPTANSPQWGCFEKDQAEALAAIGHEVIMLSVDGRFIRLWRKPGITRIYHNGVISYNLFLTPGKLPGLLGKTFKKKIVCWELDLVYRAAVKEFGKPDVLYSHYLFISSNAIYLKEKYGIPLVGIEHWSEINKEKIKPSIYRQARETYPKLDWLVTVASTLKDALAKTFRCNATVVHNMVGTEFCYKSKTTDNKLKFVSTGSLIHRKGFDLAIKAFKAADLPKDSWHFEIIGGGEERERLQKQIDEAGLSENITLVGQKTKSEIVQYLQESHIFILPSRNENFSVAVLEALACGLPVISSICGGIKECIDEKNGMLFEVDDVQGLSMCINNMMQNYSRYSPQQIAADCQARFSPTVIARQLTEVFEETIKKHESN